MRAPAGKATRPTSDRVREALFSVLESMGEVQGATVLDLFAGTGALGIEALSRGAAAATFVERDKAALAVLRTNLAVLGDVADRARVVPGEVASFLSRTGEPVDVVLADPPYGFDGWTELLRALAGRTRLLVAETGEGWEACPGWETVKVKRYGSTLVSVVTPVANPDSAKSRSAKTRSAKTRSEGDT